MFDTFVLHALVAELDTSLVSLHLQRVLSPAPMAFLLRFRKDRRLLLSLDASRCYAALLTGEDLEADSPTPFSLYLRKVLQGAKLLGAQQRCLDRVLDLTFLATTPTLDKVTLHLIAEFMGRHANLILTDADYKILQALKYTPHLSESEHIVRIGRIYSDMPSDRENPLSTTLPPESFGSVAGYSPRLMRLLPEEIKRMNLGEISRWLLSQENFSLFTDKEGKPCDFHRFDAPPRPSIPFPTVSAAIQAYYQELSKKEHSSAAKRRLEQLLARRIERTEKKLVRQRAELAAAQDARDAKEKADILLANLYSLPQRAPSAELYDFYHDRTIVIPLNERYTVQENAQFYYKSYEKSQRAKRMIEEQLEKSSQEAEVLEQLRFDLSIAASATEIAAVEEAVCSAGYLPPSGKKKPLPVSAPRIYVFEGATYRVGRNAAQNMDLSLHHPQRGHLWFHAKEIPGSHVILELTQEETSQAHLLFGAKLAAFYSKHHGGRTEVDWTQLRHVRKQRGGGQGKVTYVNHRTVLTQAGAEEILPYEKK